MTSAAIQRAQQLDAGDPKLPAKEEIEREVVAAILFGHRDSRLIFDILGADCFGTSDYQKVFSVAQNLYQKGRPFDPIAVSEAMDSPDLSALGGLQGLAEISTQMFTGFNVEHACRILKYKAQQRQLIHAFSKFRAEAFERHADVEALIESALSEITRISTQSASVLDDLTDFEAGLAMLHGLDNTDTVRIVTGIRALDEVTGGFRAGELVIVTAETGTGKTLIASQIKRVSCAKGWHCLFANGEMLASHLRAREVSVRARVKYDKFRNPERLTDADMAAIVRTVGDGCKNCRIMEGDLTIARIRARARKYFSKREIAFVIVDYDELVEAPGKDEFAVQREVVRGLKSLALELKIPIVLISQLRKPVEKEDRAKPTLSRLYGSASKIKTASIVIYVERRFVEDISGDETEARIVVLKNRDGKIGSVPCVFNVRRLEFEDVPAEPSHQEQMPYSDK